MAETAVKQCAFAFIVFDFHQLGYMASFMSTPLHGFLYKIKTQVLSVLNDCFVELTWH